MPLMPSRTWRKELLLNYPLPQEMKGINALNLEPAFVKTRIDWLAEFGYQRASPKSPVRKDFEQYLQRRRRRRLACMVQPLAGDTREGQPVDEETPKARSPRSDLSGSASAASDVAAGLYFLLATSLGPESEDESADARSTSAVTCPSLDLESAAENESVGSSAEDK